MPRTATNTVSTVLRWRNAALIYTCIATFGPLCDLILVHFYPCLWTYVHTYMYSCMQIWYMYMHTYVEAGENFKGHPQENHPSFLKLVLSLASSVRSGLQAASPQNPPVSIPLYWAYKTVTSGLVLLHAFWGSHSPCAYRTSALLADLSLLLLVTDS